jgi:hypothetical protein
VQSVMNYHAFIDASMRELNATGYSFNRMRQNLAVISQTVSAIL